VDREELKSAIAEIGISDRLIAVEGYAEHAWCVVEGEGGAWEVFWGACGSKEDLETFSSEHQACSYLLSRLTSSEILAGLSRGGVVR